jgi:undecaprenyl diphosphate synthase
MSNLDSTLVKPIHIAIIMDGNRRWAEKRLLPRQMGHRAGAKAVRLLIESCVKKSIPYVTLFAFGSENWNRPEKEVSTLLELFLENLEKELPTLQKNNIRLKIIGERARLSSVLQTKIQEVEEQTAGNTALHLILAISYGGQWDICQAVRKLADQVKEGSLSSEAITPILFEATLSTETLPQVDLLIRTSGEKRLSNFLLWQLAYAELYFTDVLWPDFDEATLEQALLEYRQRKRRFGT